MGSYDVSGLQALARAVASGGVLDSLCLRSNELGGGGARAIADMMGGGAVLTRCDLRSNGLEAEAKQMLRDAAKGCKLEL